MKFFATLATTALAGSADYSEQGNNWPEICATGQQQSPINIDSTKAQSAADYDPFQTQNWFTKTDWEVAYQAGLTFIPQTDQIYTMGGQLDTNTGSDPGKWRLAQFHLHWGGYDENDVPTSGSEHTFDGEQFFSEVHFVHYNTKYADIGEAVDKPDGLAVLGYFIEGTDADYNTDLDDLIQGALNNVAEHEAELQAAAENNTSERKRRAAESADNGDAWKNIVRGSAGDFVEGNFKHYYRYAGSLTTPGCFESVQWTVFNKPLTVNAKTVEIMCQMSDDTPFNHNWRYTQPLFRRRVLFYEPEQPVQMGSSASSLSCAALAYVWGQL